MRDSKLILLSKTRSSEASLDDERPITVANHLTKIMEKAIKNKMDKTNSKLLLTEDYQSGLQTGIAT